jgi:bifunctional polynucleotide phosphatase/kinase
VKPNFDDKVLLVKFLGKSPASINGFVLNDTEAYEAVDGDLINFVIESDYQYKVVFEESNSIKRRTPDIDEDVDMDAKKIKTERNEWASIDNKCLVFTSKGVVSSEKIAAYDLDNTIIKTMSGNVFPKSIDDWQLNMPDVPKKLRRFYENGFKICIFTNQAGVENKRITVDEIKKKIIMIQARLEVPMQFFISTGTTIYRKPRTKMWETLQNQFNEGVPIDMTLSFFVGDAAGRPENKIMKRKKDHSSADRLFALNLNLNFYTPEEHFLGIKKSSSWSRPEYNPKVISSEAKVIESDAEIVSSEQELVIMIGFPASGKSHFCSEHFKTKGYVVINRDTLNSMQKCVAALEEALGSKKSCVIDNTNPDPASRKKFIEIAKNAGIRVRCFLMTTSYHHSRHNNIFRELTDPSHSKVNDIVYNTYKNKFVHPDMKEGFAEIVKVNCVPKFTKESDEKLYRMYLLEK